MKAKTVFGVSPIIAPGYVEMVSHLLDQGSSVSFILTDAIIDKIGGAQLARWAAKGLKLYRIADAKVAFTVADDHFFMGLYNHDSTFDTVNDLVCNGNGASWGMDLFRYHLSLAQPL
jgi:predicted transcriptional regulator